jgi:hypothetical protein
MDSHLRNGTSINKAGLSRTKRTTCLGISRMLEKQPICKPGTPTQDGSNSSNGTRMMESSTMSKTSESSMLLEVLMLKLQTFKFGRRMDQRPNLGSLLMLRMLLRSRPRD